MFAFFINRTPFHTFFMHSSRHPEAAAYDSVSSHINVWVAIRHLQDNLPDALDLPAFLPGIARACRVENPLICKSLEIPSLIMSVLTQRQGSWNKT